MREVEVSQMVQDKIEDLELFLKNEFNMSKEAARKRSDRMREFVRAFSNATDYPLCRFKKWQALGYRCAVCEKDWIFAYEVFDDGIIVRDMSHAKLLKE